MNMSTTITVESALLSRNLIPEGTVAVVWRKVPDTEKTFEVTFKKSVRAAKMQYKKITNATEYGWAFVHPNETSPIWL